MADKTVDVLIVDDHNLVAKLISMMLKTARNINVVGTVSDGQEALEALKANHVDVVLLDIDMPNLDGISTLKEAIKQFPDIKIIMLSNHTEGWIIKKVIESGATGYVTKFSLQDDIVMAIDKVFQGEKYFCQRSFQSLMEGLSNKHNGASKAQDPKYVNLTAREKEVLKLIAKEMTTKQIAEELHISIRTVETHRKNILHKLGAQNTVGLIMAAMDADIL